MSRPAAVLISDVHYSLQNLELADASMRAAIKKAKLLNVPLVVAGDLHDTKANLRGECVNAMMFTFSNVATPTYILVGNHDRLNENTPEHSIGFLRSNNVCLVDHVLPLEFATLLPYNHDPTELALIIDAVPKNRTLIMHQGLKGSLAGEYAVDNSAIAPDVVAGRRVVSGHYHARQDIELPENGLWSYIGNPYTLTFGEAFDPPKGFQVLYNDGTLEFVSVNVRKHVVLEMNVSDVSKSRAIVADVGPNDLLWVKLTGTREEIRQFKKEDLNLINKPASLKITLTPNDPTTTVEAATDSSLSQMDLLMSLIDNLKCSADQKDSLKQLVRASCVS